MPLILNMSGLNVSSECARVIHGSECAWTTSEYVWIYLIMSAYVWIWLTMPEYVWICQNLFELLLYYISQFPHSLYKSFSTWTRGYLFEGLQETRGYSLNLCEAIFLKRQKFFFSIEAGSISFVFCFGLNTFTSKI